MSFYFILCSIYLISSNNILFLCFFSIVVIIIIIFKYGFLYAVLVILVQVKLPENEPN